MRTTLSLFCLVFLLVCAAPAQAQFRSDLSGPAPASVYGSSDDGDGGLGHSLEEVVGTLFDSDHFRMAQSYELSMSSFGGGSSLGLYTNSMQWQFNDAWAARVDMSVAHQPFGGGRFNDDGQNMRVFLRNAEVAYRPNKNMEFRLQIHQNPYGGYASPYGYGGGPLGLRRGRAFSPFARRAQPRHALFWNREQRH